MGINKTPFTRFGSTVKKISVAVLLQILIIGSLFAQDKFALGAEAGPGITGLSGNPDLAISAGAYFQYNFSRHFSICTGFNYDRKGDVNSAYSGYYGYNGYIGPGKSHDYLDYLTLPVMARASVGKKVIFFVEAGEFISALLLAEEADVQPGNARSAFNGTFPETSEYKRIDFGLILGAGIKIPIDKGFAIVIEERNSIGLVNVNNESNIDGYAQTMSFDMLLGFSYSFGKVIEKSPNLPALKNGTYY